MLHTDCLSDEEWGADHLDRIASIVREALKLEEVETPEGVRVRAHCEVNSVNSEGE
jgi:hypothetical protein